MGSPSPMPMKDTTQAKATANTAFGCLNGLAAGVGEAPLTLTVLLRAMCWLACCGAGRIVVPRDAGERVESGPGGVEGGEVVGAEPGEDDREAGGPGIAAARERRPACVGDRDQHSPAVVGVGFPAHLPRVLEPADQLRPRRLGA